MKITVVLAIIMMCIIVRVGERCTQHSADGVCCIKKVKI
jgi:hypothetical protein